MKRVTWVFALLGIVLAPAISGAALVQVLPASQTFFTPDPTLVSTSVDIVVTIGADENIYGMRMSVLFDPNILASDTDWSDFSTDIRDGGMFTNAGGFFLMGNDYAPGLYDDITGTLIGHASGLGAGVYTFATIDFSGLAYGTSPITILTGRNQLGIPYLEAVNDLGQGVALETRNGSITIHPEGVIPEPATLALVAAGIGAMALRRRRA